MAIASRRAVVGRAQVAHLSRSAGSRARAAVAALLAVAAFGAGAVPYQLIYTGTFNSTESLNLASASSRTFFTGLTPFTVMASFDDSSTNLLPNAFPFLGFKAFIPSSAMIFVGGNVYRIETAATNPLAGVTVAIFDRSQIFNNGRYGVGLIADVLNDGAGIVGDFLASTPDYTVDSMVPTAYSSYYGVGHGSGTCVPGTGSPPACTHVFTPWVLRDAGGTAWNLTLGNYEEDFPVQHQGNPIGAPNSAVIIAVPEPLTAALFTAGLAAIGMRLLRRRDE